MSKKAEQRALEVYPDKEVNGVLLNYGKHRRLFREVYEQAEKDLGWHSVVESLPPMDEEVIVLADIITKDGLNVGFGRIAFGHIVDKSVAIDYNGWNIPGVKFWMPMPKIPKEDKK